MMANEGVDAVGFFGALRHADFRREATRGVAAGGDNGTRRREHVRPRNNALVDGLP